MKKTWHLIHLYTPPIDNQIANPEILEKERKKLHSLAENLGLSHPVVLSQSRCVDKLIFSLMNNSVSNVSFSI
ncbi:MAG: aspartyl-phosphate phosphatase Spo0E family protein [Firmicutes bacterium]|nr:aspartyl-phosphate phosphatase Spo0E family protein [Bacillota bacterium]